MQLSPEFRFAAMCCAWPVSERGTLAIRDAVAAGIDWSAFLRVVKQQHVAGFVWRRLGGAGIAIPDATAAVLSNAAMRIAKVSLLGATESLRLQTAFDAAGIPLVLVKGVTLGALAYGSIGSKFSWDIDVLIHPRDVSRATGLLATLGYFGDPPFPAEGCAAYRHWLKYGQEYIFSHGAKHVHVELHWRLINNSAVLAYLSASSPTQTVTVNGGVQLRTLRDDDLLFYLCVHGARHNWARLKWIADVAALIAKMDEESLRRKLILARQCNADICLAQAITLCDGLFGLPQTAAIAKELLAQARYRALNRLAWRYLTAGQGADDARFGTFGLLSIFLSRYRQARGFRYLADELKMQLFAPFDLLYHPSAAADTPFYPILRVVRWVARAGKRRPLPIPRPPAR